MKTKNLIVILLFLMTFLISCQSESDIYGKWSIEDVQMKGNTDDIAILGPALSDFSYYEFTENNELLLYDSKDELLQKEKFLFSEDGSELLIKGSVDQVVKIKIISETEIKLENEGCIMKLKRK
ncbi:MAG: hypothetical protein WCT23_07295 [Candidatus Neomarinimicrobiota bacterium]|jgi:hypothetical protein